MSNDNNIRTGLWKNEPGKPAGYGGKIEIGGQEYWVNLYKNERKETDRHPDLNLVLKPKAPQGGGGHVPAQRNVEAPADFEDDIPFVTCVELP